MKELKYKEKYKAIIEGILFVFPKEFSVEELAKRLKIAPTTVKSILEELEREYKSRESVLLIENIGGRYIMTIKPQFRILLKRYIPEAELSISELKVLGIVLKKRQILKSQLAKKLGSFVYSAVKSLVEKGFLIEKKLGKTSVLQPTEKALHYFPVE